MSLVMNEKKFKRLDQKYGDEFFRKMAGENRLCQGYYEMYLASRNDQHNQQIMFFAFSLAALGLAIASFWNPSFWWLNAIAFGLSIEAGVNVRIENLWAARYMDRLIEEFRRTSFYDSLEQALDQANSTVERCDNKLKKHISKNKGGKNEAKTNES